MSKQTYGKTVLYMLQSQGVPQKKVSSLVQAFVIQKHEESDAQLCNAIAPPTRKVLATIL